AIAAAIVALAGVVGVHRYKRKMLPGRMRGLDVGQPAAFESWVNQGAGHARVRYRDALWDAQVADGAAAEPGEVLYVAAVDGNTLKVSKTRPA
ncbi:MAG: NfeD family protein, partial [Burkholderiales bacterium]